MKRGSVFIIIGLVALTTLSSCVNLSDIDIVSANLSNFKLKSTTKAEIELECVVKNDTGRDITLAAAEGFLKREGIDFAGFKLIESEVIQKNRTSVTKLKVAVELLDPISLFSMGLNIASWNPSTFEVDIKGLITAEGRGRRQFNFKNLRLDKLLNRI